MRMPASCRTRLARILPACDGPWSSSGRRPRWAATSPGWSAPRPSSAGSGWPRGWRRARGWPGRAGVDAGDAANDPGWAPDPDPRAKNRERICDYLPRLADHVADGIATAGARRAPAGPRRRLHLARRGDGRAAAGAIRASGSALAWFDAHGDFNAPGHHAVGQRLGDAVRDGLRARRAGPAGRVRRARRSARPMPRSSAARCSTSRSRGCSPPAPWPSSGPGCWPIPAGLAALRGWAATVAGRIDGWYVAFDMDALDEAGGWAVMMPEPGGLSLETALEAVRIVAASGPVARLRRDRGQVRGGRRPGADDGRGRGPRGGRAGLISPRRPPGRRRWSGTRPRTARCR